MVVEIRVDDDVVTDVMKVMDPSEDVDRNVDLVMVHP